MSNINNDHEYIQIVGHILDSDHFHKLKTIEHHGITRYDHSIKVSYYSYKVAKILKLNYEDTARGGLLHDFFLSAEERNMKERFVSTFNHPKKAALYASTIFHINDREADIIRSHMFPVNVTIPKYAESWLVDIVDKTIGAYEFMRKFGYKFVYGFNLYVLFLINTMK